MSATLAPADDPRPASLDPADFDGLTDGLIVLSGCRAGELSRLIDRERITMAMVLPPSIPDVVAAAKRHNLDLRSLRTPGASGTPELEELVGEDSSCEKLDSSWLNVFCGSW